MYVGRYVVYTKVGGVSSGDTQLAEASHMALMACSWASEWAVVASVRKYVSVVSPWKMRLSGVTTGVVMVWWRNSTVLDIFSALVSCAMIRWHQ